MPFIPFGQIGGPLRGGIENISASRLTGGVINSQQIIIAGGTQGILRSENYNQDDKGWALFGDGSSRMPGGLQVGNGVVTAPSYSFMSATNLGMYKFGTDKLGFAAGDNVAAWMNSAQLAVPDGLVTIPGFTFINQTDMGMYVFGTDSLGFATAGALRVRMDNSRTTFHNIINYGAAPELTVASGEVTITGSFHAIDTESDASTDDLDEINGGSEGDMLILRSVNNSRDTTLTDNSSSGGNMFLKGALDFALNSNRTTITLLFSNGFWLEVVRSVN